MGPVGAGVTEPLWLTPDELSPVEKVGALVVLPWLLPLPRAVNEPEEKDDCADETTGFPISSLESA